MKKNLLAKKLVVATAILTLGVGALTGCGSKETKNTSTDNQNTEQSSTASTASTEAGTTDSNVTPTEDFKTLKLGVPGSDDSISAGLANVAIKEGYLEEELNKIGYTLETSTFITGPVMNEAFAGKSIDAAIYGDFPAFTNAANGLGAEIVAVVDSKYQYAILVSDGSEITSAKDLEGQNVMVPAGTVVQYFWDQYVEANGLDASKINVINSTDAMTLFQTGDITAAAFTIAPAYFMEDAGYGVHVLETGENAAYSTLVAVVDGKLLEENNELGVAINKALIEAYQAVQNNPALLYEDQASASIGAAQYEKSQSFDPTFDNLKIEITDETISYFEDLNNWLIDNQVIFTPVELDGFVHREYYEQAIAELNQ